MTQDTTYNRLSLEKSAYLLQHKDNLIHWYSYGPEAIQKAKDENKPIFLSVGYSTCHWCHVMSHESFDDQETADFMNENFINIKVDKEELPDIDNYYQQACHLFTQSGGWPLSAFLLPDMRPFFVGTYFPKKAVEGQTTFKDLTAELLRAFKEEKEQVETNATNVTEAIAKGLIPKDKVEYQGHFPPPAAIMDAVKQFADEENGGYGKAPKFPQFSFYEWAIEQMLEGMIQKDQGEHIIKSIEKMLMGGIYDHARGGIHRYATDESWLVPHFEKMIYDQAGLLRLLAKASVLYPSPIIFDGLIQTLDYLEAEMLGDNAHFLTAQDADAEGVEGLYHTFSLEEFEDALKNYEDESESLIENSETIKKWFGITKEGNFDKGLNVISLNYDLRSEFFTQDGWNTIRKVKKALQNERKNRIPPMTDNKGVASWNFMMVTALVDVMQYCQIDIIRQKASALFNTALEGLYKNFLVSKDDAGMKIKHSTTREQSLPYLEDYVNFAETQLRVYEITGNPVFKGNFADTLEFIHKEFIHEGEVLTRSKSSSDFELYPNQAVNSMDQSYKSSASTLIQITRRAAILFGDREYLDRVKDIQEDFIHESLKNPLSSAEALRALSYPDSAYRVVKLPTKWLENPQYINFMPYFLSRFVLDYIPGDEDKWEICNLSECEITGNGLEEFIETLRPTAQAEDEGDSAE
ncbi:thioredoxin domain-containing protein [Halobacteriovorax marinus]|uniref:thioredoxin domain-containing protein n=1 Tax=Halobacteriovorax marinus TaxID=97084 RepID=UPI003A8C8C4B